MIDTSIIGNLMYLYLNEIEPAGPSGMPSFAVNAAASLLRKAGGRNWLPIVVKIIGKDRYQVIGNSFTYEVARAAGLERVWCVIADNQPETAQLSQVLAREQLPKINLCQADFDDIRAGLEYLIENRLLTGVQLDVLLQRINDAPDRKYWTTFDPIIGLKCKVKKTEIPAFSEVFELKPEPVLSPPAKVNLCTATPDEIRERLQYLMQQPESVLKGRKLDLLVSKIASNPERKHWSTFDSVVGVLVSRSGSKDITNDLRSALTTVFYLEPEPVLSPPAKVNLCTATPDEIRERLQYLMQQPQSVIKDIQLEQVVNEIATNPDRRYWSTFDSVASVLGISSRSKTKLSDLRSALTTVFYLEPEPVPPPPLSQRIEKMNKNELINLAREMGLVVNNKMKKEDLKRLILRSVHA